MFLFLLVLGSLSRLTVWRATGGPCSNLRRAVCS